MWVRLRVEVFGHILLELRILQAVLAKKSLTPIIAHPAYSGEYIVILRGLQLPPRSTNLATQLFRPREAANT